MRYRFLFMVLIITVLLSIVSCSTTRVFEVTPEQEFENTYKGTSISDILDIYGKPYRTTTDGNGGMIVSYETVVEEFFSSEGEETTETSTSNYEMESTDSDSSNISNGQATTVYKNFYINDNGVCYKVETNDYLKGGIYRKYFNRITITELSIFGVVICLINLLI